MTKHLPCARSTTAVDVTLTRKQRNLVRQVAALMHDFQLRWSKKKKDDKRRGEALRVLGIMAEAWIDGIDTDTQEWQDIISAIQFADKAEKKNVRKTKPALEEAAA